MLDRVLNLVSEALDIDESKLSSESAPGLTPEWDSLSMLNIVSAIEQEFDISLELEDIFSINNIQDIVNLVEKKAETTTGMSPTTEVLEQSDIVFDGLLKPDQLVIGSGSIEKLGEFVRGSVLIILGSKRYSEELAIKIKSIIGTRVAGITFIHKEFGEPSEEKIKVLMTNLNQFPDVIVGVGGGSVIDTCKLVYTKLLHPEKELSEWKKPFSLPKPASNITLISIPTTHGSGAEASSAAVFNDYFSGKKVILSHQFISKVVIYDSSLLVGLPRNIAIDTTLDAFTHSIEGHLSKLDHPNVNPLIVESLSIIIDSVSNREEFGSEKSINQLLWASYLAGIVQNHCSTGLCHSISHQLSRFGIGHGRLNAIFLPEVLKFNYSKNRTKLDKLSRNIGFNSGEEMIKWLFEIQYIYDIGNLAKNMGDEENIDDFSTLIKNIKDDVTYSTTPFEIDDIELLNMLKRALTK